MTNLQIAREYIKAIESGSAGKKLAKFFAASVVFEEMPNAISPKGSIADLAAALQRAEIGKKLFQRQTYTILSAVAEGNHVALELDWTGITAVQIQNLPPGSQMRDHAAIFLEFREGRVIHQRHYDCFEPW